MFAPRWAKHLPGTVDKLKVVGSLFFDDAVEELRREGFQIANRVRVEKIDCVIRAQQFKRFMTEVGYYKYLPEKDVEGFVYVYFRSLYEDKDFNETINIITPFFDRYTKSFNLFESDIKEYIVGHGNHEKMSIMLANDRFEKTTVYLAASLFGDKRLKKEIMPYIYEEIT